MQTRIKCLKHVLFRGWFVSVSMFQFQWSLHCFKFVICLLFNDFSSFFTAFLGEQKSFIIMIAWIFQIKLFSSISQLIDHLTFFTFVIIITTHPIFTVNAFFLNLFIFLFFFKNNFYIEINIKHSSHFWFTLNKQSLIIFVIFLCSALAQLLACCLIL